MKIAIDLDEVVTEFLEKILLFYEEKKGRKISKDDFHVFEFWKVWGGTKSEAIKIHDDFYHSAHFDNIEPTEGAIEAIKKLRQKNEIFILTSRPDDWKEKTESWIKKYLGNFPHKLIFTSEYRKHKTQKSQVCNKLKIDLINHK